MKMEFRVYQLLYSGDLTEKGEEFFQYLRNMSKIPGEFGFDYCITNEIDFNNNIITFCFSEEYEPDISSVDDDKNVFVPDVSPYINTLMAIDLQEKRMIVQNREYPANNLDKHQTMTRVGIMLNEAFEAVYNSVFNYLLTDREVQDEEFERIFNNFRISSLWIQIPNNLRFIPDNERIFEDELLNRKWIEGWNNDQSGVYEVLLKAPGKGGDGDLRYSPIAISLMKMLGKEVKQIDYWDDEGNHHQISRNSFRRFVINGINLRTQVITAIDRISSEVYNRRAELRSFVGTTEI
jgi:hypothetical protein